VKVRWLREAIADVSKELRIIAVDDLPAALAIHPEELGRLLVWRRDPIPHAPLRRKNLSGVVVWRPQMIFHRTRKNRTLSISFATRLVGRWTPLTTFLNSSITVDQRQVLAGLHLPENPYMVGIARLASRSSAAWTKYSSSNW
jgi:hypothetical protein